MEERRKRKINGREGEVEETERYMDQIENGGTQHTEKGTWGVDSSM